MPNLYLVHNACANDRAYDDEPCYQGDITTCTECRTDYSEFEHQSFITLGGATVCTVCAEVCGICDMWFDDDSIFAYGPLIVYCDPLNDDKRAIAHAGCLMDWILEEAV
jgi:hypothetical protein